MYQLGMFYPFFRAHNEINYQDREPWLQPANIQDVISDAIKFRYSIIHYLYTMFYESSVTGAPLLRAMWYEFREDESLIGLDKQFMFGESILVCPKEGKASSEKDFTFLVDCVFPTASKWYNWYTGEKVDYPAGVQTIELPQNEQGIWVKEGSMIPLLDDGEDYVSLKQALLNTLTLHVYLDENYEATGYLYNDDKTTFNYKDGQYDYFKFEHFDDTLHVTRIGDGDFDDEHLIIKRVQFHGLREGNLYYALVLQPFFERWVELPFHDGGIEVNLGLKNFDGYQQEMIELQYEPMSIFP